MLIRLIFITNATPCSNQHGQALFGQPCQLYNDLSETEHLVYGNVKVLCCHHAARPIVMREAHDQRCQRTVCRSAIVHVVQRGVLVPATWPVHGQHVTCYVAVQAMHQMTMMRAPDSLFGKGSAPSGHWAECAAQMQLAPEQVQHLFSIREAFCKRAAALRDQRRALVRQSTQVLLKLIGPQLKDPVHQDGRIRITMASLLRPSAHMPLCCCT